MEINPKQTGNILTCIYFISKSLQRRGTVGWKPRIVEADSYVETDMTFMYGMVGVRVNCYRVTIINSHVVMTCIVLRLLS